jgi:hypothetical protein
LQIITEFSPRQSTDKSVHRIDYGTVADIANIFDRVLNERNVRES